MDQIEEKRLELLHQLVPQTGSIGILIDPTFMAAESQVQQVRTAARALQQQITILTASTEKEIEAAFATFVASNIRAVAVAANPFFNSRRERISTLAMQHAVATLYEYREAPAVGGLMSYGPSIPEAYRQVGIYAGRVLKGEKPADLPVLLPTKFEMVINLKTAKALGITVPLALQAQADEVIE